MKSSIKFYRVKNLIITAVIVIAAGIPAAANAGAKDSVTCANTVKSMLIGINSSNAGLAQSSIYLAGCHKYAWAVEPLIKVLTDRKKDTNVRISAAYSLIMIGDERGLDAIKSASLSDENYMLKGLCEFIYNNFKSRNEKISLISE